MRYLLFFLFASVNSFAGTITVSSLPDLQKAIGNAVAGDVIILVNGMYTAAADIIIDKQGTAEKPITISAQTIGGAEISGAGGFNISGNAAYIIIKGFKFTHNASKARTGGNTHF